MSWKEYYNKKGMKPSESLRRALDYFNLNPPEVKTAIDLGCGNGRDTLPLLNAGWKVYAIDSAPDAISLLEENVTAEMSEQLELQLCGFADVKWRPVSLINASLSLPFCEQEHFARVWENISESLLPNGIFTGHFFGINDDWKQLSLVSAQDIESMFNAYEFLFKEEKELDRESVTGPLKHWHIFEVTARKRS